jgi:integrase
MVDVNFFVKVYMLRPDDYLFYRCASRKHISVSRQYVHRIISRTASNLGLRYIGAHSMRKIYACRLFSSTGSIDAVQAQLNHRHISTTLIYLKDLLVAKR